MNLLNRHAISTDILVDHLTMLLIVAEGIKDLGESEVRQPPDDFFWGDAKFPQLGDCTHRSTGTRHDGGSMENLLGADNVRMACGRSHDRGLLHGDCSVGKPTGGRKRSQFELGTATTPKAMTTTFGYDAKGNLTTITNALNKTTTITVNTQGQPLTITDPLSNMTTFTYEVGDLVKVKDPLNRETQRILDAAGRLRNITNPLGQKTLYTPDALDRITQLTDAINGNTAFTYDANSNLLTVTDAKTQQTVYTYSNMNRTSTRKDPLLNTETYTYDNNGNVATVTDRKSQVTTNTYDALNRKTKATFHDSTSTNYTYDAGNRITQVQEKDAGGTVTATITRTYDGLDRLTQEVTAQGQVDYVYDNASRRTSMTVAGQTAVNFTYDNANRLTQVQQGTATVTLAYDDADRRTSLTLPTGTSITYAYNAASELTSLTYKQGTTTIGDLTYTYDAAGNRIKTGGSFARSGLPPAVTTVSYNANNQQTTFGTNTITYDLNGNLATVTDAGVTTTYTWNVRNQLTGISNTGFAASFTYDSFGRRTGKTVQRTTTNFVYDGLNPVQEKNGGTVTANLLTGLGIDEFFQRTDGVGSRGLLPDALGSTIALGDSTGTLQTQYTYEPFGYVSQTGQANTSSYKYTGREDDGSGLDYYRARYYHPRLQRFITEDPAGLNGGSVNFYEYAGNNPVNFVDPLGLYSLNEFLQDSADFSGGFGDTITFGGTRWIRQQMGTDNFVNKCSSSYTGGKWSGYAWEAAFGGAMAARAAGYEVVFWRYKNAHGVGMNILEDGKRIIGLDWHEFKSAGNLVNRPHIDIPRVTKHWPWPR